MTNFEELTKDTETLAEFLTLINDSECKCCIAQEECKKLQQADETYELCTRSWDAWLNKEVINMPQIPDKVDFDYYLNNYNNTLADLIDLESYYNKYGPKEEERRISEELKLVNDFIGDLKLLKLLYEVAPNSPYRVENK